MCSFNIQGTVDPLGRAKIKPEMGWEQRRAVLTPRDLEFVVPSALSCQCGLSNTWKDATHRE